MFQRQLSTTALLGSSSSSSPSAGASSSSSKLFQRQLTASQLFTSSSSSLAQSDRSVRSASGARGIAQQQQQVESEQRKPAKNRRIISRMLSISAIHSSPTNSTDSNSANVNQFSPVSFAAAASSASQPDNAELTCNTTETSLSSSSFVPQPGEQTPDRIDSSFVRSRSSSSSSTIPQAASGGGGGGAAAAGAEGSSSSEILLCLCFLDQLAATTTTLSTSQQQPSTQTQQQTNTTAQVHQGPPSSASSTNHKSPNSNAAECAGQQLALWLGTSHGSVLLLSLSLPDTEDNRVLQLQSVQVEPIPQAAIKMPGALLSLALFTSEASRSTAPPSGSLASQSSSLESEQAIGLTSAGSAATLSATVDSSGSSGSLDSRAATFLSIVSEKEARIYLVPPVTAPSSRSHLLSHHHHHHHHHQSPQHHHHQSSSHHQHQDWSLARLLHNQKQLVACTELSESSFAAHAALVQMRSPDETCLVTYLATGNLRVHSLPALRLLMDADFVPYTEPAIARSMRLSRNGHALYRPSSGELCKFSLSAQYRTLVSEMTGALYVAREMPEQPRANFFKSLFSSVGASSIGASRYSSDRDELFSECAAGKAPRTVAKHISAPQSALDKLKGAAAGTAGYELRAAREGLDERAEKLSELEDRTLQMMNQSESYSQAAHQLAQKFKDKKWYQF